MLVVLSPAKRLDFDSTINALLPALRTTQPQFLEESQALLKILQGKSRRAIARLMDLSDDLAALNHARYKAMVFPFTKENARPALLAFKGDVYQHLDTAHYTQEDFTFAQQHLRILSGFYGLLRPLDLIQPYRLEMGTRLKTSRGANLYAFWGEALTRRLNQDAANENTPVLINLASQEYFAAIKPKTFMGDVITLHFKERKKGKLTVVGLLAKRARGAMADYIIRKRITDPEALKRFTGLGYRYQSKLSNEQEWVLPKYS